MYTIKQKKKNGQNSSFFNENIAFWFCFCNLRNWCIACTYYLLLVCALPVSKKITLASLCRIKPNCIRYILNSIILRPLASNSKYLSHLHVQNFPYRIFLGILLYVIRVKIVGTYYHKQNVFFKTGGIMDRKHECGIHITYLLPLGSAVQLYVGTACV